MKTFKIITKAATLFGAVSIVFVVLAATITYALIQIVNSTAPPTDYIIYSILTTVMPYLFIAVLSLVTAVILRRVGKENQQKEAAPQTQSTEPIA
jgi:heme/copper-type cytochrome/quinol oxidase subunit 2